MKEVMAIIRMNKINATKSALVDAGFPAFTANKVMGRGKKALDKELVKAIDSGAMDGADALPMIARGPSLMPKRLISLIVPDECVKDVVKTIMDTNKTGNPGDGKIFVMPILDVVRVRTGEAGGTAVDEMTGKK